MLGILGTLAILLGPGAFAADVTLDNGMKFTGKPGRIAEFGDSPKTIEDEQTIKPIVIFDDDLKRIYFPTKQVASEIKESLPIPVQTINLGKNRAARVGSKIGVLGPWSPMTPFDEFGRRLVRLQTAEGPIEVVQGLTRITPKVTWVESLAVKRNYQWDMRVSTESLPRDLINQVLRQHLDWLNPDDRLLVVRLFIQAERFQDAAAELEQVTKDFPELTEPRKLIPSLQQRAAQKLIDEIGRRKAVGQHRLAATMLAGFPPEGVATETLVRVRDLFREYEEDHQTGDRFLVDLLAAIETLPAGADQEAARALHRDIQAGMTFNTLDRAASFIRLADDPLMPAHRKVGLAGAGWLLGPDASETDLKTVLALIRVRDLIGEYIRADSAGSRQVILAQIEAEPAATPDRVANLLAMMRPPLPLPEHPLDRARATGASPAAIPPSATPPVRATPARPAAMPERPATPAPAATGAVEAKSAAPRPPLLDPYGIVARRAAEPDAEAPAGERIPPPPARTDGGSVDRTADGKAPSAGMTPPPSGAAGLSAEANAGQHPMPQSEDEEPGYYRLTVPGLDSNETIVYHVQLPPEYDPNRRYPCVVTLASRPEWGRQQLRYWTGPYHHPTQTHLGQAARHGFVIISPEWAKPGQSEYQFTAREHAAVLYPLRDAMLRINIDTDRVFLSGHAMGGVAAWDLGVAHPDLWAGVIPIVAQSSRYISKYADNAKYTSWLFVGGELDGEWRKSNRTDFNRYLSRVGYDVVVFEYQGRGHEPFTDAIHDIFTWMDLHKRRPPPKDFEVISLRPWDNFFWYVETSGFSDSTVVVPAAFDYTTIRKAAISKGKVLANNGVSVQGGGTSTKIHLTPDLVDFSKRVVINNRSQDIKPSLGTMLEDVRLRGDRLHPVFATVDARR